MSDELTVFDLDMFNEIMTHLNDMEVTYTQEQMDIIHKHMRMLEEALAKECAFLRSIECAINIQTEECVRRKYETTWGLYKEQYPTFMEAFVDAGMEPDFISQGDWSEAKSLLQEWESQQF
jgi:hypothetical protein